MTSRVPNSIRRQSASNQWSNCVHFAALFVFHWVSGTLCRVLTLFDLAIAVWHFRESPAKSEQHEVRISKIFYLSLSLTRLVGLNILVSFRKFNSILIDICLCATQGLSLAFAIGVPIFFAFKIDISVTGDDSVREGVKQQILFSLIFQALILSEFITLFGHADRVRARQVWQHNATFRFPRSKFSLKKMNPFRKAARKDLLLPLISHPDQADSPIAKRSEGRRSKWSPINAPSHLVSPTSSDQRSEVHLGEEDIWTFHDKEEFMSAEATPRRSEQLREATTVAVSETLASSMVDISDLHVHCLVSRKAASRPSKLQILYLHQFGSGAFTWQPVMSRVACASDREIDQIAFDRYGHGLTVSKSQHFPHLPTNLFTAASIIPQLLPQLAADSLSQKDTSTSSPSLIVVAAGGYGARLAFELSSVIHISGLILISPSAFETNGIPSILRSISSTSVGRALTLSMARTEIASVLPKQGWSSYSDPRFNQLIDAYRKSVQVPEWEDAIVNMLQNCREEIDLMAPDSENDDSVSVSCPAIILFSDSSESTRMEMAALRSRYFPSALLVPVPETGSSIQEQRPEFVANYIVQFIQTNFPST